MHEDAARGRKSLPRVTLSLKSLASQPARFESGPSNLFRGPSEAVGSHCQDLPFSAPQRTMPVTGTQTNCASDARSRLGGIRVDVL
jgi:hypothetical protein